MATRRSVLIARLLIGGVGPKFGVEFVSDRFEHCSCDGSGVRSGASFELNRSDAEAMESAWNNRVKPLEVRIDVQG